MKIFHDSFDEKYRSPFGAVKTNETVQLGIFAEAAVYVQLRLWTEESGEKLFDMTKDTEADFFSINIRMPKDACVLWYFFVIHYDNSVLCYGNNRNMLGHIGQTYVGEEPESFQITVYEDFQTPQWFKQSLVYQIFPDRFNKSASAITDTNRLIENWNTKPYYIKNEDGSIRQWNFWGGNLKGIEEKIPYLKELGVNCIYLNPIFKAKSNHRYDTADYFEIDPLLGTKDDFISLCKTAKQNNIFIILDGVFSHTGSDCKYKDEHPDWYTGTYWWGVKDLPEVDETKPSYLEFICGENGVLRYWLRLGAFGWRFDVADELPDIFIEKARLAIKAENPDAVLIGEVWEDASNKISYGKRRKFLLGKQFDSVMNYPLRNDIIQFLNNEITAFDFEARVNSLRENYPKEAFNSLFNLLGSHDRERILSVLGENKDKQKLAALICLFMPGPAVIYYGDEAGLCGGTDPENRASFPWGNEDKELTEFYKTIGLLFSSHESLKNGDFTLKAISGEEIIICRTNNSEKAEILINKSTLKYDIIFSAE